MLTVDLADFARFNEMLRFPVYFPLNNAKVLVEFVDFCNQFRLIWSNQ